MYSDRDEKRRGYLNTLATMSNVLHAMQHKHDTWDSRMKAIVEMQKLLPLVIRYMVYFKNTEESQ